MIRDLLANKIPREKANITATEIARLDHIGKFFNGTYEIEILSLTKIEEGVEILARAWRNGKQVTYTE